VVDPFELALLKLPPPPLPSSWGRMIKPYAPANGARRAAGSLPLCVLMRRPRTARARTLESVPDAKHISTPSVLEFDARKARVPAACCGWVRALTQRAPLHRSWAPSSWACC
jgi:hypothetical protein